MKLWIAGIPILLFASLCRGDAYVRQPSLDVLRYELSLEISDATDVIHGKATLHVGIRNGAVSGMWLDLEDMIVDGLRVGTMERPWLHEKGRLSFEFDRKYSQGETAVVEVQYHGKPESGMLVGKNSYGRRVFFSENWPDRAHHWFPAIDHPSDKAQVNFTITAPERYEVVANGRLTKKSSLLDGRKITQWSESKAIPTYCMVIGAAEFTVKRQEEVGKIPVFWYVYPQDFETASRKFQHSASALRYFTHLFGPYPYEKLAQVESTTRIGGMENASAIFYSEPSFQRLPVSEDPVPHEIAHQWFGDSITEADWDHLWLSEGFATYLEALFHAHMRGADSLKQSMERFSKIIREYPPARSRPVIDPQSTDLMKKLNPLNYQKGAWILHMLRGMMGDRSFFEGMRRYYLNYQESTALTEDFQKAMESAGGMDLASFFQQWLYQPGWPDYRISWKWDEKGGNVDLSITQAQSTGLFDMPVEIVFQIGGRVEKHRIQVDQAAETFRIPAPAKPLSIQIDPEGWLLKTAAFISN
jgi:aminopeptidase N